MNRLLVLGMIMFALVFVSTGAVSQSIYGLNYIGEHHAGHDARVCGLGLAGYANCDSTSALAQNLAVISDIKRFTFSVNQILSFRRITSGESNSNQIRFELPSVMIAVPLTDGLVFGVGYRTRFLGKNDFSFERVLEGAPIAYEVFKHRSSLFTVPVALAYRFRDLMRVAFELQVERGSLKDEVSIRFGDEYTYLPAISSSRRYFSGKSFAFYWHIKILPFLYMGGVYDSRVDYDVEESFKFSRSDLDSTSTATFDLPHAFGIGLGLNIYRRWWFYSSYWSRERGGSTLFPQLENSLTDAYIIGFGVERKGRTEGSFLSRIPVRFGFYQEKWQFEFPDGEPLYSRFLTIGTGFALPSGPGRVDFAFEFGQVGSSSRNGVVENVMRIGVSVSAGEKWTKRNVE